MNIFCSVASFDLIFLPPGNGSTYISPRRYFRRGLQRGFKKQTRLKYSYSRESGGEWGKRGGGKQKNPVKTQLFNQNTLFINIYIKNISVLTRLTTNTILKLHFYLIIL